MVKSTRRPLYHDYQPPKLFRAGCVLRRSYLTGPAGTAEETAMAAMLERADKRD